MRNSTDGKTARTNDQLSSTEESDRVLVACGVSGSCTVFIDETIVGPHQTHMQIDNPAFYVSFGIASEQVVDKIMGFIALTKSKAVNGIPIVLPKPGDSISIGKNNRFPVRLICDSEDADRFVFMVGTAKSSLVRYTIHGDDLAQLIDAIKQVRDELASDGLL